jgi:hypothetical protein
MSSYVDLLSDERWTEQMHVARVDLQTQDGLLLVRERVLTRRSIAFAFYLLSQMLPAGAARDQVAQFGRPLSASALAELTAAAQHLDDMDALAAQARADGALLNSALDYEDARAGLAALPAAPTDGSADPDADQRAALQAVLAAATRPTLDLVAQRDAWRAAQNPEPAP